MISKLMSITTALGLGTTLAMSAYAGSFSDSFDYTDDAWPWESFLDASGGDWVYNDANSHGNMMNMNAVGVNAGVWYGKSEYNAPVTSDFYNGSVSTTFTFDSFEAPLGQHAAYMGVTARTQADGSSLVAAVTAKRIDPAADAGVGGDDNWYNLFIHVPGTDLPTLTWINTMSRANEVYSGKNMTVKMDILDDDVTISLIMDKSNDFGATWTVEEKSITAKITDASLMNAGAAGIHINQLAAPGSHHMYGAFTDFEVVIPEPASLALLGLGGLVLLKRRH